jgi:hypothetical protein
MNAGTYKVKIRVTDAAAYESHHGHAPAFKSKVVERWLNSVQEKDDLFGRWAAQGISATLGKFVGR